MAGPAPRSREAPPEICKHVTALRLSRHYVSLPRLRRGSRLDGRKLESFARILGRQGSPDGYMTRLTLRSIEVREIFPGLRARIVHSARTSQSWVEIDEGATFPEHKHPHEQVVNVLEGVLELTVNGEVARLEAGDVYVIPPDAPHSGRALTACRVLDVFAPVREDYR